MPNPAWGGQGVLRNTPGSAVSYEMGVKVQNKNCEVAIYVQWYEKTDLNSDERKYRANGILRHRQFKTTNFCSILDSRCSSCLEIPILWQEVVQDLIDSDELQQLHHQVWGRMLDQSKTINSYESWHDKEYGIVWEINKSDRDFALGRREL